LKLLKINKKEVNVKIIYDKNVEINYYDLTKTFVQQVGYAQVSMPYTFTTTETTEYIGFNYYTSRFQPSTLQIEENLATEYEEYTGQNYEIWLDNNMFDKTDYRDNSRINSTGGNYDENGCFTARMIKVEPNTTYVKNSPTEDGYHRVAFYTGTTTDTFISKTESNTFTTPATCQYLRFCV